MKALVLLLLCVLCASVVQSSAAADKETKVLRHIVLYKFKDTTTPEQIKEVVDAFVALPKQVDGIIGFEHGTNVSKEQKSEGLTHAFVVTFPTQAALDAYIVHPAHQAYVNIVKDRREKVVVLDFWTPAE